MSGADEMVLEYALYRGFSKTFRTMEIERNNDRTKLFEADRIVSALFDYLHNGDMDAFISTWDFLNKRFFIHLDQEHLKVARRFKLDLLRFYLVIRQKQKDQKNLILDFFNKYSSDILSSETATASLRCWYILPYMDEPSKDPEFAPYFSPKFEEMLRNGLQNFISMVLRTTPLPKLLLMERWYRSEKQQQMRTELDQALSRVTDLHEAVAHRDERIAVLQYMIRELALSLQKAFEDKLKIVRVNNSNEHGNNTSTTTLTTSSNSNSKSKSKKGSNNASLLDDEDNDNAISELETSIRLVRLARKSLESTSNHTVTIQNIKSSIAASPGRKMNSSNKSNDNHTPISILKDSSSSSSSSSSKSVLNIEKISGMPEGKSFAHIIELQKSVSVIREKR